MTEHLRDFTEEETEAYLRNMGAYGDRVPDSRWERGYGDEWVRSKADASSPKIKAAPFRWRDPSTFPLRRWLYGTTYIRQFITVTAGPGGFGKSSLVLVEAIAMATGRALLDVQPREPMRVWYVNLEDPLEEVEKRVAAICLHFQITEQEIGGRLFLNSGDECEIMVLQETGEGARVCRPIVDAVLAEMKANAIDALFLDPFASTHGIDENSNAKINAVKNVFVSIARQTNASVGLVHHVRKGISGQGEFTIEDTRGAKALMDGARVGRILNGMSKQEADGYGLEEPRRYFHITHGKSSLAPPTDKREWFHLKSVSLGNGEVGIFDDSDFMGVVETWSPPDPQANVTVQHLRDVQAAVAAGQWRENHQAKDWVGIPIGRVLKLDPSIKAQKKTILGNIKVWLGTGALVVVTSKDAKGMDRPFVEVGTYATDN